MTGSCGWKKISTERETLHESKSESWNFSWTQEGNGKSKTCLYIISSFHLVYDLEQGMSSNPLDCFDLPMHTLLFVFGFIFPDDITNWYFFPFLQGPSTTLVPALFPPFSPIIHLFVTVFRIRPLFSICHLWLKRCLQLLTCKDPFFSVIHLFDRPWFRNWTSLQWRGPLPS